MLWRMPDDEGRPQTNLSTHLEFPDSPRRRIHVDFCRTIPGESFLVFVYAYLKWPEVVAMDETTTDTTVDDLRALFARWGIPLQMVTDNGPKSGFERFLALNSIQHNKCSPYHPATNVLLETFAQTFRQALKFPKIDGHTLQHRLASFLLNY